MPSKITIDPITRLEGHGRIDIFMDDSGAVERAFLVVPELRGFEIFMLGRPAEDAPQITSRICGVCPTAHHMASTRAMDDLWKVDPPRPAKMIREFVYSTFMLEDHALHFYVLGGPDFIVGPDAPPMERNILGVVSKVGVETVGKVIEMRKRLRSIIQTMGGKVINPVMGLPGGVSKPVPKEELENFKAIAKDGLEFALFTHKAFEDIVLKNKAYVDLITSDAFTHKTYCMGLVDDDNKVNFYSGKLRVVAPDGKEYAKFDVHDYIENIGEHVEPWTYMRFTHLKKIGWKGWKDGADSGIMSVAPLARINASDGYATPKANELREMFFKTLGGRPCHFTLANHWARVIEMVYAAERMNELINDPEIMSDNVRTLPTQTPTVGIGVVEAPRGVLIHHYETDEKGLLTKVNLHVATQHNAARMGLGVDKAAKALIKGPNVDQGTLNKIEMVFRAYDPCDACATHTVKGETPLVFNFRRSSDGSTIRRVTSGEIRSGRAIP
jgi:F420-non-reducing hydrogenase large subunit